jgi:hypothetical protein
MPSGQIPVVHLFHTGTNILDFLQESGFSGFLLTIEMPLDRFPQAVPEMAGDPHGEGHPTTGRSL